MRVEMRVSDWRKGRRVMVQMTRMERVTVTQGPMGCRIMGTRNFTL